MPPIELGPTGLPAARAVGAVDARSIRSAAGAKDSQAAPVASETVTVERSDALDPGAPPVDSARVAEIRKAIEQGEYPVIPMRVADAMIAAGMLLRSGQ